MYLHIAPQKTDTTAIQGSLVISAGAIGALWSFDWDALRAYWGQSGKVRIIEHKGASSKDGSILHSFHAAADLADINAKGALVPNATLNPAQRRKSSTALLKTLARRF